MNRHDASLVYTTSHGHSHAIMHLQGLGGDVCGVWCAWGSADRLFTALIHSRVEQILLAST